MPRYLSKEKDMRLVMCFMFWLLSGFSANAAEKVALIIGNTDYESNYDLVNPINDAKAISAALTGHGFGVTLGLDLTRDQLIEALMSFREAADMADVALVYYSGHGMEFDGENYLIPVDAKLDDSRDIPEATVPLSTVLRQISGASRLKMVVLDACRNNPFVAKMASPSGQKYVSQGLVAPSWQGDNTLIAYAAAAGAVTPDGQAGGNSPYTASFLDALAGPPRDVGIFMRVVGAGMRQRTGSISLPFVYSSIPPEELIINSGKSLPGQSQSSSLVRNKEAPKKVERIYTERELASAVQDELNRHLCGALTVDGVFGKQSQAALQRFYQYSGIAPTSSGPTPEVLKALETSAAAFCPPLTSERTLATASRPKKSITKVRPDPVRYSYEVWPARSVRYNRRVTRKTAYGQLTCLGGRGASIPRKCNWK
jgi:hypothetical protein